MLNKAKEKDAIDQLLDRIDFHGMTAKEPAGENCLLKKLTSNFYSRVLDVLRVNSRNYDKNINKILYVALEINWEGRKEIKK